MKEFVGYIYFDRTREWESYFSTDAHWADDEEDWFLGGSVRTIKEIYTLMYNQGFDDEYIGNFIALDVSHYDYMQLYNQSGGNLK